VSAIKGILVKLLEQDG
jgi:hypothetical protein